MQGQQGKASDDNGPVTKRRRAPKGEMRRAALLDAATKVFAKHGYAASSMRDIASLAGITTVGLLHHFPNKVSLLKALLARRDRRITEKFAELEMVPTLEGFVAFASMSLRFSVESRLECQAAMMINVESLAEHHPAWAQSIEKFEMTHTHAQAHLTALKANGEIRADVDVARIATELFALMDGLQIQWLRDPDGVDTIAIFDDYLARLAGSLRPQ